MFENEKIIMTIERQKNIALIAHDSKKHDMIDWCNKNKNILKHLPLRHRNDRAHGRRGNRTSRPRLQLRSARR